MSVMQFGPRSLLAQRKSAALTITRLAESWQNLELRRRRVEERKKAEAEMKECYKSIRRTDHRCNQPRLAALHDECLDPCDLAPLPLDMEHYTPSDKNRKYQRTWCECYALPMKFISQNRCYPNRPRRKLNRGTSSGVCVEATTPKGLQRSKPEKLVEVQRMGKWPCCKLVAPGCEPARADPNCGQGRPPTCCKKRRTQYPSFSECQPVGLLEPIPPCECIKQANLCDVWTYWQRYHNK
ncbi:uncharacterized protein LOC110178409 [Drosophila serrata]|uniref:uncharacterized protein LOC110178409 n=1 Tax=Drosophila serrata TaxID=7274 RepID=UPI000A1D1FB3|nr:uncharacterized protein LOC110178409 [Drosophila serrata]KAH8375220.1 hypothetical protein KR200_000581 [Drosophila serrata]